MQQPEINNINKHFPTMASAEKTLFSYSGMKNEDLLLFVEKIQQYSTIHNLTERQISYLIRFSLKGIAKTWVRTIPDETQFPTLITLLCQRFQTQESQIYHYRLLNKECQVNEDNNILNYLDKLYLIALKGNINENFLVSLVLSNLTEDWESKIAASQIPGLNIDWKELYRIASIYKEVHFKIKHDIELVKNVTEEADFNYIKYRKEMLKEIRIIKMKVPEGRCGVIIIKKIRTGHQDVVKF